jgi:hypothetical protein
VLSGEVALNTLSSPDAIKGHGPAIYLRDAAVAAGDAGDQPVHGGARRCAGIALTRRIKPVYRPLRGGCLVSAAATRSA